MAAATGLVLASSAIAAAAERPSFEVKSFPISPMQVAVLGAACVNEQAPAANLTVGGMPASPAQIAVPIPGREHVASVGMQQR
jgi:hypothetical protein